MKTHLIIATVALAACGPEISSYETFRASLDRFEDAYVVEGDLLIHGETKLRAYYDANVARIGTTSRALILNRVNGADDIYTANTENNLTYCVSDDFNDITSSRKATIVNAMATAAANWEAIIDVDFRYVSAEDDDCDASNNNVWFNVRPSGRPNGWAYAFYPHEARSEREITAGDNVTSSALMTHELGHVLGFRHEFERPEYADCNVATDYRVLSPYDEESVMHYPPGADRCAGSSSYTITRFDTLAAQRIFGGPANACSVADREVCSALGGQCEVAIASNGIWRHDLCRWDNADTQAECSTTSGLWTPWSSTFAQSWPTAVRPGDTGACITQMNNVSCSGADEDVCLVHGATCERAYSINGTRRDLCRWSQATSSTACAETNGIWTTAASSFSQTWPTSVPDGQTGACITQVQNLD